MSRIESGDSWEVRRGFIPRRLATAAGREALLLGGMTRRALTAFTRVEHQWDNDGLSVITVDVSALEASIFAKGFSSLLDVYGRTESAVGNGAGVFYVNKYGPRGSTRPHADKEAEQTLAVGLIGQAEAVIHDPNSGEHRVPLHPTDALYFDNRVPVDERPVHVVRNVLVGPREALVNG